MRGRAVRRRRHAGRPRGAQRSAIVALSRRVSGSRTMRRPCVVGATPRTALRAAPDRRADLSGTPSRAGSRDDGPPRRGGADRRGAPTSGSPDYTCASRPAGRAYDDVAAALDRWRRATLLVGIISNFGVRPPAAQARGRRARRPLRRRGRPRHARLRQARPAGVPSRVRADRHVTGRDGVRRRPARPRRGRRARRRPASPSGWTGRRLRPPDVPTASRGSGHSPSSRRRCVSTGAPCDEHSRGTATRSCCAPPRPLVAAGAGAAPRRSGAGGGRHRRGDRRLPARLGDRPDERPRSTRTRSTPTPSSGCWPTTSSSH